MVHMTNIIYNPIFSVHSFGFRLKKNVHMTMEDALPYLNEEYEWIVVLDI